MPAGRPTALTPQVMQIARNYLTNYQEHNHVVPSVVGLCTLLTVSRSSLYGWCDKQETDEQKELLDILESIKTFQHFELTNKGLAGDTNSVITKLMLTKHGYSDKQETQHSGHIDDYSDKSPDEMARLIAEREQAYAQSRED